MQDIQVLIADHSASGRAALSGLLSGLKNLSVVATAMEPHFAVKKIEKFMPHLVIIDSGIVEHRNMEDLWACIERHGIPVILLVPEGEGDHGVRDRFPAGMRIETVAKAAGHIPGRAFRDGLIAAVSGITGTPLEEDGVWEERERKPAEMITAGKKYTADIILPREDPASIIPGGEPLIAIGASTGGTELVEEILTALPGNVPPMVIALHLPGHFTRSYAERINRLSRINVREGEMGDAVRRGTAIIAPGNRHMVVRRSALGYEVDIVDGPQVNRHRPSIDVLFRSAAHAAGRSCTGILCTGMGSDGARGLLEIREAGGLTIAQDEETSVVFGMPRAAIRLGAAVRVLGGGAIMDYIRSQALN